MGLKILIYFICLITAVRPCFYSEEYGGLSPDVAYVEVGHELSFNCSLVKKYVDDGEIDVSKVFFDKNEIHIDQRYVQKLDPYTVQLKIPNASLEHLGMYSCKFNNSNDETKPICYSDAYIGFKPLEVSDFKCIYYHRQKLLCSWTIPNNPINTQYSLYHYFEGLESEKKPCGNESSGDDDHRQYCFWDHNTSHVIPLHNDKYYLILYGENKLGVNNQPFEFNLTSIVRLPPPRKFQFSKGKLQWIAPENVRLDEKLKHLLRYRILVIDRNNRTIRTVDYINHDKFKKKNNIYESLEIKDLKPFTQYTFNITCKADDSSNDNWSDMVSIHIVTEAKAPFTSPKVIEQSFENTHLLNSQRRVVVYWDLIPEDEKNGPDFEYFISYSEHHGSEDFGDDWINKTTIYPNITLVLKSNVVYIFRIFSKNSIGLSSNYSMFLLPQNHHILWNNSSNVLSNMIKVFMFDRGRYEINWTSIDSSIIKDYTLFWCPSMNGKCIDQIHWKFIDQNKYDLIVSNDHHDYKFGVSYNSHHKTTGIIWAKCVINMLTKKVDGINFSISDKSSHSVLVHWKLSCEAQRALIDKFHIPYCNKPDHCQIAYADREKNQYLLTGLEPHTEYNITVTSPQLPYKNEEIKIRTDLGIPPPAQEFSVDLVNESDFFLKWKSPESATLIKQYMLEMIGPVSPSYEFIVKNGSCMGRSCNYTITGLTNGFLKPFSDYSFFLMACNKHCSKKVQQVYRTKPSNPGLMLPPTIAPIDDKLRVYLKHPIEANGPIDYYHIKVYEDTILLLEERYTGHLSYVDIDFDSCKRMKNNKKYYISVKASNVYDNILLSGNYTEKMQIPLYCPSVYNLLLFSIIGLVSFLIVLYFALFYSYRMFKSIKKKNDDFTLNIAMEDQTFIDQFNKKSSNRESSIEAANVSESSLVESDSANVNINNSSNSINETAIFCSGEHAATSDNNNNKNSKNYIKLISNRFCSSDSGVSDMNHHDNLEYFWNQDYAKEPFLKKNNCSPPIQLVNGGDVNSSEFSKSSTAPSSSLPSPEHSISRTPLIQNSTNNAKQAYVWIPSSNNSKYLPHSHTTYLPDSYNINQV